MKQSLKVAAYARISTDKDDQINSLESQKRYFADYIRSQDGWELTRIYYDEGISGTQTKNRAGFLSMIDAALHGGADLILTKEVCRFARNTVDTLSYTRQLKEAGVGVIFTIDHIDTRDPDGELRLTIMACLAQEESRKTSERVKWGQKRRMEQGIVFGRDLLGYTVQNGILSVNAAEAPIVCAIFHKYTNEGKGAYVIAKELNSQGVQTKRIHRWSHTTVLRILRNEKYAGDLCQKKTVTPDFLTHAKKYNDKQETMICHKDHHEPIISRELWNRTRQELLRRSPKAEQKAKYSGRYWCSGKICCAVCGSRFVSRTKKRKDGTIYQAWRCQEAARHGAYKTAADGSRVGCSSHCVSEQALLSCVSYAIALLPTDPETLQKEILKELKQLEQLELSPSHTANTAKIRQELLKLQEKKRKTADLLLEGLLSKEDFQAQTAWYEAKIQELSGCLTAAESDCAHFPSHTPVNDTNQWLPACTDALIQLTDFKNSCMKICQEVLERMDVHADHSITVWLKCIPFGIRLTIRCGGKKENFQTQVIHAAAVPKRML